MLAIRNIPVGRRVSVSLDPGMVVEALILQRLDTVPKRRHSDWIRTLLVQGFLAESRVHQQLGETETDTPNCPRRRPQSARSGFNFGDWHSRSKPAKPVVNAIPDRSEVALSRPVKKDGADKPFAHLRKVVG